MMHGLYPANTRLYDVFGAFKQANVYWPMNSKASVRDVIYIYLSAPHGQIGFVCEVVEVELDLNNVLNYIRPFYKR